MCDMEKGSELKNHESTNFLKKKLKENHEMMQGFNSHIQELQKLMNSMNVSKELQEVESNHFDK